VGVAAATIISQLLSVVLVLSVMLRTTDVYRLNIRDLRLDGALLLEILDLGLPAGIQTSLIAIGNLFTQRFVNLMGSAAMAGIGAAKKVDKFIGIIANSLGLACSTFVGQNVGAKQPERAFQGVRVCTLICFAAVTVAGAVLYIFAGAVIGLFTEDAEAIGYGADMVRVLVPLYYLQIVHQILSHSCGALGTPGLSWSWCSPAWWGSGSCFCTSACTCAPPS
jgi:Na+-driven multidrug efflux pump